MQNFIIELLVNSVICFGARFAFMDGNVLSPLKWVYGMIRIGLGTILFLLIGLVCFLPGVAYVLMWDEASIETASDKVSEISGYGFKAVNRLFLELEYPLWECVKCMASIWGVSFLLVLGPQEVTGEPLISLHTVIYVFALCGVNVVLATVLDYLEVNSRIGVGEL